MRDRGADAHKHAIGGGRRRVAGAAGAGASDVPGGARDRFDVIDRDADVLVIKIASVLSVNSIVFIVLGFNLFGFDFLCAKYIPKQLNYVLD